MRPSQGLGMLYGPRGCGKTWLAASIAFAVATGGELCGKWKAPRPGRVLYVDGELPAPVLRERLLAAERGRNGATVDEHSVRILAASIQSEGLRPLDTEAGQLALEPFLEDRDLVILDNLSSLIGCRENEADDWGPMQRNNDPAWFFRQRVLSPCHAPAFLATRGPGARKLRWIVIPDASPLGDAPAGAPCLARPPGFCREVRPISV